MTTQVVHRQTARLTPKSDVTPVKAEFDDTKRLREIRELVSKNNRSQVPDDVIICQIYMESRFDSNAQPRASTARGLMQLLKVAVREVYRIDNLKRPTRERRPDSAVFVDADRFHDSPEFVNDENNIQLGTKYMQILVDRANARSAADPISDAYKDYRGVRNGIYYAKIKAAAEELSRTPENMDILRKMVK